MTGTWTTSGGWRRGRPGLLVAGLVLMLAVPAVSGCGSPAPAAWTAPNPFADRSVYVDPDSTAAQAVRDHPQDAAALQVIAGTAQARWFTDQIGVGHITAAVDRYVSAAVAAGQLPLLTAYAIPHRDCGQFSAGGLTDAAGYGAWIRALAAGLGGRGAAIVLEPDALPGLDCLSPSLRRERMAALSDAVTVLASAGASVYIDAGHSRWLSADELAGRLAEAGVREARGFSLNVSNFFTTAEEIAYGEQVAELLGGARYVIDTSRNGAGPAPDAPRNWCNPPGRALGTQPTTDTGAAHADALLWIKHPGESDGDCNRGDPRSGLWFHSYAMGLIDGG